MWLFGLTDDQWSRREVARYIGYVPQSMTSVLTTTVFYTILMGRKPHMGWRVGTEDLDRVVEIDEAPPRRGVRPQGLLDAPG